MTLFWHIVYGERILLVLSAIELIDTKCLQFFSTEGRFRMMLLGRFRWSTD